MSELKLISPLLDHMSVVSCLGSHGGVSCYVLKHESLSTQFVLKHISIPQSEEKTAALLLAGAFADEAGAHAYYGQLVEDLEAELALARRLSETQNFLVPLGAQAEPKASGVGYDFYILSPMRRSLRAFLAENAMTNLKAVNCGIDLCNALCALREQNLLFRDLRPENIYLNEKGRFLLGDLGLSETELLQFSSLPESDKSDYTPPEFSDMMANLNLTMDTYALGMTLYRIYNGNHGPFEDEKTSHTAAEKRREAGEALPAPLYADYELAEILCKACAPKPEDRYASPDALRQALVFYMQRNSIADDLIVPPILTDPDHQPLGDNPEEEIEPVSFTDVSALDTEFVHSFMPDVAPLPAQNEKGSHAPAAPQPVPEPPEAPAEASETPAEAAEAPAEAAEASAEAPAEAAEAPTEAAEMPAEAAEVPAEAVKTPAETVKTPAETVKAPAETVKAPIAATQASIKAPEAPAETAEAPEAPAEAAETAEAPAEAADQTESLDSLLRSVNSVLDLDGIRQRADSTAPESNAAPLKIAVKEPEVAASVQPEAQGSAPDSKKKKKKRVTLLILIGVLAALLVGIYFFLWKWYFIEVNAITLVSKGYDRITVSISANVSDPDLTVTCRDAYGNSYDGTKSADGISFTGLTSNTQYTIELSANENHRLTRSSTSRVDITTYESTSIAQLSVKLGEKEGTAEVSVDFDSGLEPDTYLLSYVCDGEAEKTETFTGSTCTLTDLKLNADYTFRLEDHGNYFMVGQTTAQAKILPPVQAENLHVVSIEDGVMEVAWDCGTENAAGWTVTCTDGGKYSEQVDSESCSARFSGTSTSQEYTVKVTSATLYNPLTLTVDSDPMIVKNLAATAEGTKINVSWDSLGGTPEGGWQIEYQIDTADGNPSLTTSDTNSAVLSNVVPNAAYTITLKAEDGHTTVGNLTVKVSTGAAEAFDSYSVSSDNVIVGLYARPSATNWTYRDLSQYKTSYSAGEAVAFALQITGAAETSDDKVVILTVVRNSAGDPLYVYCSEPNASTTWNEMWTDSRYVGEVEAPQSAGSYTLEVYLNGRLLESTDFTVA